MSGLEIRKENQEQYSRRKSLKLHNIQVLVDVMIIQSVSVKLQSFASNYV
jgi:hypothetical protein